MDGLNLPDEQALTAQLEQARGRLDGLLRDLQGIDHELEELSAERHRYRLLGEVCGALDELRDLGAASLFWDGLAGRGDEHLGVVRGRLDTFQKHVGEIEDRRQGVVDEIERVQEDTEFLEDDLDELRRREEERKLEWIVEREMDDLPDRPATMPWARGGEDDQRFRKTLLAALLLSLLFGFLFPLIDLPVPERWEAIEVPERFTRLIREERPAPPPVPVKPKETLQEESSPEEAAEETQVAKKEAAPKSDAPSKGILAFREQFSDLAESLPGARLGSAARIRNAGEATSGRPTRSLVTAMGSESSGGIDVGSLSRSVGGGGNGIEGVQIARATSTIGGGGGSDRPLSDGPGPGRTDEEIQIVFDRHKAALYRLYNRELRKNPTLRGQMVLRIRIEPDGSVSLCELQSSDMDAPNLATQVLARVKAFDFGAKEGVATLTILYPIDFLPAT